MKIDKIILCLDTRALLTLDFRDNNFTLSSTCVWNNKNIVNSEKQCCKYCDFIAQKLGNHDFLAWAIFSRETHHHITSSKPLGIYDLSSSL